MLTIQIMKLLFNKKKIIRGTIKPNQILQFNSNTNKTKKKKRKQKNYSNPQQLLIIIIIKTKFQNQDIQYFLEESQV